MIEFYFKVSNARPDQQKPRLRLGFAKVGRTFPAPYKTSASPRFWAYFRLEIKKNSIQPTARMFDALAYVINITYARKSNFLA